MPVFSHHYHMDMMMLCVVVCHCVPLKIESLGSSQVFHHFPGKCFLVLWIYLRSKCQFVDGYPLIPYLPDLFPYLIALYSVFCIAEYLAPAFFSVSPWVVLDVFDMG